MERNKKTSHNSKTWFPRFQEEERKWWLIDAEGHNLGRLATQVARILRGKHKVCFTPHVDTGDFVVVLNSEKIHLSGKKKEEKKYHRHSRFFGSLKEISAKDLLIKQPEELIRKAVKGMLPRNKLARKQFKKLKVYTGSEHPHQVQKPILLSSLQPFIQKSS